MCAVVVSSFPPGCEGKSRESSEEWSVLTVVMFSKQHLCICSHPTRTEVTIKTEQKTFPPPSLNSTKNSILHILFSVMSGPELTEGVCITHRTLVYTGDFKASPLGVT